LEILVVDGFTNKKQSCIILPSQKGGISIKRVCIVTILILSLFTMNMPARAAETTSQLTVQLGNFSQTISDGIVATEKEPYLPLRDVLVLCGAQITWANEAEPKAIITTAPLKYQLVQDPTTQTVLTDDGSYEYLLVDGSMYLPLRFFEHILNYRLVYENGTLTIDMDQPPSHMAQEEWKSYRIINHLPDYVKTEKVTYVFYEEGEATWYGEQFEGRRTSSGERFDSDGYTAAHRTLPFGTRLRVTALWSGASVEVTVNDRGPYHGDRILDLSQAAAREIGLESKGVGTVKVEIVETN